MFENRFDAAQRLAAKLSHYVHNANALVVAIPHGGLQIGYGLAKKLQLPLRALFIKKIGHPMNEELAIGAVSLTDVIVDPMYRSSYQNYIQKETQRLQMVLQQRYKEYYGSNQIPTMHNKIVILTDDGVATGYTIQTALAFIKREKPTAIIVALPVAPRSFIKEISHQVNEVICLEKPETFFGVGQFYRSFPQVHDDEAIKLLREANA
jgi:predicted phosphoribosyltransferase